MNTNDRITITERISEIRRSPLYRETIGRAFNYIEAKKNNIDSLKPLSGIELINFIYDNGVSPSEVAEALKIERYVLLNMILDDETSDRFKIAVEEIATAIGMYKSELEEVEN